MLFVLYLIIGRDATSCYDESVICLLRIELPRHPILLTYLAHQGTSPPSKKSVTHFRETVTVWTYNLNFSPEIRSVPHLTFVVIV
jgi:hypothetical protein